MNIGNADLLDGEASIQAKSANAIIRIDQYGLSRFAGDKLFWIIDMKGKEAIGNPYKREGDRGHLRQFFGLTRRARPSCA